MAEVIGLTASIIQLAQFGGHVLLRLRKLQSSPQRLSPVFEEIQIHLPLVIDIMERFKNGGDILTSAEEAEDAEETTVSNIVRACRRDIESLNEMIENARDVSSKRLVNRLSARLSAESQARKILERLERYKSTLTLYLQKVFCGVLVPNTSMKKTYYEIPSLQVSHYVKRVELMKKIEESFINSNSHRNVVVLLGMGGQGKTQLAIEYCLAGKNSGKFQAIFWLDASSRNTISHSLDTIVTKLSVTERVFDDMESKLAFVKETLEERVNSWLLVFDNFDDPSAFSNIMTYLPQGKEGALLFTSRHADCENFGVTIKITPMTEDESVELLLYRSKNEQNDENTSEGRKIVKKLGYLPLAVVQAGAYICARQLPLQLFERHYDERREVVLKQPASCEYRKKLGDDEYETSLTVFTTWELSFEQINKDNDRTMIGHFLTLSAFINATDVDEDLFKSYFVSINQNPQTWMEIFNDRGRWDQYKYQDILVQVSRLSLLQTLDIGDEKSYFSLHPLVAEWLKMRNDGQDCQEYTLEAIAMVAQYINTLDQDTLPLHIKTGLLSHVDMCVQNVGKYFKGLGEAYVTSVLKDSAFTFATLYSGLAYYKEAEVMYKHALAWRENQFGLEDISTLDLLNDLGILHSAQSNLVEAEGMYVRALAGREKVLGRNNISTLLTVNNLGNLYQDQGKLRQAEDMYKRALEGKLITLEPGHTSTLETINNLGILYHHQGKLTKAGGMYQRALAGFEMVLGLEHSSTLATVNNLGNVYSDQAKLAEAELMYKRAKVGFEKTLGLEHNSTLDTVHNLGNLYANQNNLLEAEHMYDQALAGREKVLGLEHTSTLDTVYNLGSLYKRQNRLVEAEVMLKRAVAGREKSLGPIHSSTLAALTNLCILYRDQDRLAEAEVILRRL